VFSGGDGGTVAMRTEYLAAIAIAALSAGAGLAVWVSLRLSGPAV
jgi:hypothetical protein